MLYAVIDLSHWNTVSSWPAIAASGIVGVIHKVTEGTSYVDDTYRQRRQQALDAGLLWGAYHFANGEDPQVQAAHFLEYAAPDPATLLVLDLEENPSGKT